MLPRRKSRARGGNEIPGGKTPANTVCCNRRAEVAQLVVVVVVVIAAVLLL